MDIAGYVYKLDIYQQNKRAHLIILSKETIIIFIEKDSVRFLRYGPPALNYKVGVWYDHPGQLQPVTHSINISCTKECVSTFFLKKKKRQK
jgi:hypothetical protein